MSYDIEKINCLRLKISAIKKELCQEKDTGKRRELEIKIKICELKIMIAKIK